MKNWIVLLGFGVGIGALALQWNGSGQTTASFSGIQSLTNREILLRFAAPTGFNYRVDVSTNLPVWEPLVTFGGNTTNLQHTDSAAPYILQRFYRAEQVSGGTNTLTGDHVPTAQTNILVRPLFHATFLMSWNGKIIYVDPDDDPGFIARYSGLPKGDLILVTHDHGDHFSSARIDAVRGSNALIVVPPYIYTNAAFTPAQRAIGIPLPNGGSTNVMGITVEAVPAYNSNHALGRGNGYVLTIDDKRIYISGDTGNQPELRALANIDVAFLCMNLPFTMSAGDATNLVRAMQPRVVYPYHYRNSGGVVTNAPTFKEWLGSDLGIEVRLRNWY